jgi:hypothetical protein
LQKAGWHLGCLRGRHSDAVSKPELDFVLCNAVLEHVPYEKQDLLAREIRRVARFGYFVATPFKWFPIDPHTYLPLYHLLPANIQRVVVRLSLGHMRRFEPLYPVDRRRLQLLFPDSTVVVVKLLGLPVGLVAVGGMPEAKGGKSKTETLERPAAGSRPGGMVYFAGPASGRLIVYRAQSSSDAAGIGAGSVSPCSFRS